MRFLKHITLALCLFPLLVFHPVFSTTVRDVGIEGNAVVSTSDILGWMTAGSSKVFSAGALQSDLQAIHDGYRSYGYLNARVRLVRLEYTPDSTQVDVTIGVEEGKQSIIGSLDILGSRELMTESILEGFETSPGDPLVESRLEEDIGALLARYEELGLPFARCSVTTIRIRDGTLRDSIEITLGIDEGQRMTIDEIRVEGNSDTDTSVIVRETRIHPGDLYDPGKVDAIRSRLNRLNIFASVGEPRLYVRGRSGGLLLRVEEGNTNTFDGVLGYVPESSEGEEGYVTGLVAVSMRNLFGTGRKLQVRWYRQDRLSQELSLRYVEPWIFGFPVNIGGGFFQRQQDSAFVDRRFDVDGEFMVSEEISFGILLNSQSVIPSEDSTKRRVSRSSAITLGADLTYDSRDAFINPQTGVRFHTDYQYGRKTSTETGSELKSSIQRIRTDFDLFVPTWPRQVVAVGAHVRQVQSGYLEESDMYRFGGASTLRGYRENEFLGSLVIWTRLEYRFVLARRAYLFGFFDTGYYSRPSNDTLGLLGFEDFKYGYGIGVTLDTAVGVLGVMFALGEGDTFATGKIHFGLINDF
ncbi:MAG: POTRA domain-containing protein [Bacteroidota bacterium]